MAALTLQPLGRIAPTPSRERTGAPETVEESSLAEVIQFPGSLQAAKCSQAPATHAAQVSVPVNAKYRLTTRGWIVVSILGLLLAVVVGGALGALVAPIGLEYGSTFVVSVAPGETLWSIAASIATPGQDVRDVIEVIKDLNGMSASAITAGQELILPSFSG